jgi:dienelactone hydrolase
MKHYRSLGIRSWLIFSLIWSVYFAKCSWATEPSRERGIVPTECLVIKPAGQHGRTPIHIDEIEADIVHGKWKAPKSGQTVAFVDGSKKTWESLRGGKDGVFEHESLKGGYAFFSVRNDEARVMLLEASGHQMVYVNGEPRAGDPYQAGNVRLPVSLRKGDNELLFYVGRGKLKARLVPPRTLVSLDASDMTLPDVIIGEPKEMWASIVLINAGNDDLADLTISTRQALDAPSPFDMTIETHLPMISRLSVRKVAFRIICPDAGGRPVKYRVGLFRKQGNRREVLDVVDLELRSRRRDQSHKQTFVSSIDGSVQYYAVNPAQLVHTDPQPKVRPALFLTLHGAGVEAIGQVEAYNSKSWGYLVGPTNRRPYGFDWEDWGRLDALEVLDRAQTELGTDPQRTYLTGHSMGGHGTWHIGANHPDRFAAIGPSAGWITMWTYAGAPRSDIPSGMVEMLQRPTNSGDTFALIRNYLHHGVYILHGSADDNVPVDQARLMREQLTDLHHDFVYHEQAGAGHWWDVSDEPGADCVDWAPMFDLFAHHAVPRDESLREIDFTTASPGISARSHWLSIEDQIRPGRFSSARIRLDPGLRRFSGKTVNVSRLTLDVSVLRPGAAIRVELEGKKLPEIPWPARDERVWLVRSREGWHVSSQPSLSLKGPHRYGPFKDAFRNRVMFVYGTKGSADENAWAFAKARFDAETFWYRGNGSIEVIADSQFDSMAERDRNVVLYGNAETNGAWHALLGESPVLVKRGRIQFGKMEEKGEDLACLFVRPRPGSDRALVGVVTGTGISGMRLTDRLPYFMSGVGYPDLIMLSADVLKRGVNGVRWAGYFGSDWGMKEGEFVRNK